MKKISENFIIRKKDIHIILKRFLEDYKVYGPVRTGVDSKFDEIKSIEQLHLDYISTVLPPKKFFHPPKELLFSFEKIDSKFNITEEKKDEKIVIFGIHPCDVHAILKLDNFFSRNFKDQYYRHRRKKSVLIALNCIEPDKYAFCNSTGTGPFLDEGFDILLTDLGTKYLIETGSKVGFYLFNELSLIKATNSDLKKKNSLKKRAEKKIKKLMDTSKISNIAEKNLEHHVWLDLGEHGGIAGSFPCLSCGSCTFVCPTCYCYDIYDSMYLSLIKGTRNRELDSCQLLEYGEVALDGNFRRERKDRIRHWMLCKFGAAAGGNNSSCVGCGRCIRVCPSKIDITEVAKVIRGD